MAPALPPSPPRAPPQPLAVTGPRQAPPHPAFPGIQPHVRDGYTEAQKVTAYPLITHGDLQLALQVGDKLYKEVLAPDGKSHSRLLRAISQAPVGMGGASLSLDAHIAGPAPPMPRHRPAARPTSSAVPQKVGNSGRLGSDGQVNALAQASGAIAASLPEPLSRPKVTLATFLGPSGVLVCWPLSGKSCLMAKLELEDTHLGSNPGCHSLNRQVRPGSQEAWPGAQGMSPP